MSTTGYVSTLGASEETPKYRKVRENRGTATPLFMVICDEGWRETIVCSGMYERVADWLITQVQGKPFATGERV